MERAIAPASSGTWDPVGRRRHHCDKPDASMLAEELGRLPVDGDRWTCGVCGAGWEVVADRRGPHWTALPVRPLRSM